MESRKLSFTNSLGVDLSAYLDVPLIGQPRAYAIFSHCFTCSKNLVAVKHISSALVREGIAVFRFDFTGLGESAGDFSETNFSTNVMDIIDAANYLAGEYVTPALLIGHSLGGPAAIAASTQLPSTKAVVTIGSPCEPAHVTHLFDDIRDLIHQHGEAEANIGGRQFTIKKQFLQDLENTSIERLMGTLGKALLVCHSPTDLIVEIDQAAKIYAAAKHPKSFVSLDNADHLLSRTEDSLYVGTVIAAWASRYIDLGPEPASELKTRQQYVVVRTDADGFFTEINANGHPLLADEPIELGGTNRGPTPYELLASSLGACTAMTLQMYAKHKKLPMKDVTVHLQHNKVHCEDGTNCENKDEKIDEIVREIEIRGDLTDEQRQRMLEIANRCPVHKTLGGAVRVVSRLK